MGRGGITITAISDIRQHWCKLLKMYEIQLKKDIADGQDDCYESCQTALFYAEQCQILENPISTETMERVFKGMVKNGDTPFIINKKFLITSWGDGASEAANTLSEILDDICEAKSIETWT